MNEQNLIEANFIVLNNTTLECPRCGIEFNSKNNMIWLWGKMKFIICCPLCATVQKEPK